jgi:Putative transposase
LLGLFGDCRAPFFVTNSLVEEHPDEETLPMRNHPDSDFRPWSQRLGLHPHVHCVVPAGGLSLDHTRWIKSRQRFFLSIHVLRRVFRGKFVAGLRQAFRNNQLVFHGSLTGLAQAKVFAVWLRPLFRKDWVVYSKPPFGSPEHVLKYLGRYTHRVAISNHRLVSFAEGKVTFRWRDSAHYNEQKLLTLPVDDFLRRFLLHLLPKGFVRIRNFGFLANRKRATTLPLCFQSLRAAPEQQPQRDTSSPQFSNTWRCPQCGAPMAIVERLSASEIQLRSPPLAHETTLSNSNSLRAWARAVSPRVAPNKSPLLSSSIALPATLPFPATPFPPESRVSCTTAQSGHTSTPLLPTIEFA